MQYAAVLWDADETLFDYRHCESEALSAMFAQLKLPIANLSDALSRYGRINDALWARYNAGEGISQAEISVSRFAKLLSELQISGNAEECSQVYTSALGQQAHLLPNALETVKRIAPLVKQAIVTNGIAQVQRSRLSLSPIAQHMGAIVISGEEGIQKPNPRMFTLALERLGLEGQPALMVGDNPQSDIAGALSAGLHACWLRPKGTVSSVEATYAVSSLAEIPAIVEGGRRL